jgi:DNA polymerase
MPAALLTAMYDPKTVFVAHNAAFERAIFKHILGPRYGWPEIELERWRCTMAMALALALPAKLKKVVEVLNLTHRKADDGIMHQMAAPRWPRQGEDPTAGPYWFDDPERLEALCSYCKQDVEAERELYHWLPPLNPAEQQLWQLDQIINDRGFYADGVTITKSLALNTAANWANREELQRITGGEVETIHQVRKLLGWLAAHGCEVKDLQKGTLSHALRRKELAPEVRRVLELRKEAAHTSADKMQALHDWRGRDGRVRGAFQFHGAATGRWSGRGPQPQNFRRESEDLAAKFAAVATGELTEVCKFGAAKEVIGDIGRAVICAAPGNKLLHGDYSAIESRALAWTTRETSKLALWAKFDQTGLLEHDPYYVLGRLLGFPEEIARSRGKVADLAFGYGGGVGAYKNFAPEDDNTPDLQIEAFKQTWRSEHPNTVQFWRGIESAAIDAIRRSSELVNYGRFKLRHELRHGVPFLFITLPSGRDLSYPFVKLIRNDRGFPAVSFMDNALGKWVEVRQGQGIWGGLFTENIVSGVARDLLAAAMLRLEAAGYPIVTHVHDSIAVEVPDVV